MANARTHHHRLQVLVMTTASQIRAVVFDLGGVLLDWDPEYLYRGLIPDEAQRRRFLTSVCTPAWNYEMDAGRSVPEAVAALAAEHPEDAEWINAWWARWPEMLGGEFSDTVSLARRLADDGVALYALTNFAADTWPLAVERFPFLESLFDGVVVSGHERLAKPDRRIFDVLNNRYNLNPHSTAFIDDSAANVDAAAALGYLTHNYTTTARLEKWLTSLGLLRTA
ncbi:MAG: HAD-IA family hydrolase [Actinomycetota bacterium]